MDDAEILHKINSLVDEEKHLRSAHARDGLHAAERDRLTQLEEQLDQAWDLLRQRRAREEFGENPENAETRTTDNVEHYLQ